MRKVIFSVANSLDNFIARKDDALDWLLFGDEAAAYMKELWKRIDTILMGRKTYEISRQLGSAGYPAMKTYVFSRTLTELPAGDAELICEDPGGFVRDLKTKPGRDIFLMGGTEFANSLFKAGVIDEVGVNIHPLLLGSGIPLFLDMPRQIDLDLLECRPFKNGCVLVLYQVKASRAAKASAGGHP